MYRPVLNIVDTFDANEEQMFHFEVVGGRQIQGNRLTIIEVATGKVIYKQYVNTFRYEHYLPAKTLSNAKHYIAYIETKDISDAWSPKSTEIMFWCYSKPNIDIITIDDMGRVYNQTVLFEAIYTQSENEIMESYKYNLYNSKKGLLHSFPEQFSDGSTPLTQEISGLENGEIYYVEVVTLSPSGNKGSSGLQSFTPFYKAPRVSAALDPVNHREKGAIRLRATIIQIILELYDKNGNVVPHDEIKYVDGKKIDLNKNNYSHIYGGQGIEIPEGDYVLKLWIEDIPNNSKVLQIWDSLGYITIHRYDDRFLLTNYINGYPRPLRYISNTFNPNMPTCLTVRHDNGRYDIVAKLYEGGD